MRPSKPILGTLLITSAMGLALAACNRNTPAQQPLSTADLALPATAAATSPGPVYDRYGPPPKKIPVGRVTNPRDDWAWAERSYALDNAFYDTAPDYGFYYDDDEPWVWQTSDRWAMYGDPYDYGYDWDDDGYYYYYQPGAVRPYFIRDAYYGYGFDDVGRLVVIYDLLGRIMPQSFLYEREPYVSRYYQRAYLVRQASLRVQPVVITQAVWQERAPIIQRYQSRWIEAARTQPQWVDYRQRTGDRFVRAFDRDRQQRQQRTFAANGQPQQTGGLLTGLLSRNRQAQPAQVAQNDQNRRSFLGLGARDRQPQQALPQQPLNQADRGRDRQRQDRALQPRVQAQANQDRRGFFTGRDRRADQPPRQAETQARPDNGRQRQEMARQQQRAQQRQAEAQVRLDNGRQRQGMARQQQAQQRQAEVSARQQQQAQQRQAEAQSRQQQQAQQRQAEVQARQQQQAQQRQAEAQARQQQQAQQRQAEAQSRQQQQAQQRQAEAQARQQQQAQQRQAEAQARQQQQAQQRQAEAQARQQQQAQQRQAEAQARQQQQAQQRQAEAQARQQQQAQQAQAKQQQRAQQPQRGQEADAQPQQNGAHGHGKKG